MKDKVLETVVNGIKYAPLRDMIVKPLPAIKVKKEISEQIPNGKKDKEGFNLYDVKTSTKTIDSEWREGIVLVLPTDVPELLFEPGDKIVYHSRSAKEFDLFKDSVLVKTYDVIAKVKE